MWAKAQDSSTTTQRLKTQSMLRQMLRFSARTSFQTCTLACKGCSSSLLERTLIQIQRSSRYRTQPQVHSDSRTRHLDPILMPSPSGLGFPTGGALLERWTTRSLTSLWLRMPLVQNSWRKNTKNLVNISRKPEKRPARRRLKISKSKKGSRTQASTTLPMEEASKSLALSWTLSWYNRRCALTLLPRIRATRTLQRQTYRPSKGSESCHQRGKSMRACSRDT